jgi:hypothetical protein
VISVAMYRDIFLILLIVMLFVLGFLKQCGVIGITAFLLRLPTVLLPNLLLASLHHFHALFEGLH